MLFSAGEWPLSKKTLITRVCRHDDGDGRKSVEPSGICSGSAVDCIGT